MTTRVYVVSDPVVDLAKPSHRAFYGQIIRVTMHTYEIRPRPDIHALSVQNDTDHHVDVYREDGTSVTIPPQVWGTIVTSPVPKR